MKKLRTIPILLLLVCAVVVPAVLAKPESVTIPIKQTQFQCRLWDPPGWKGGDALYQNWETEMDLLLTGKVLHTTITYSPPVENEEGTSTIYVYDKKSDLWIQHEGTISYTSPYSGLTITEYWRGYLEFDDVPGEDTFEHGVGYQWGYVYGEDPRWYYTHAIWDETMGAWLLGFSIYLWDPVDETQDYDIAFPDPFIEPVPASNYNPLDL